MHEKHPDGNSHVIVQVAFRLYHYSQIFTITVQVTVDICRHIFRALDEAHTGTLKIFFFVMSTAHLGKLRMVLMENK